MPRTDFMKMEVMIAIIIMMILTGSILYFMLRGGFQTETYSMILPIKFTHVTDLTTDLNTTIEIREFESRILLERLYVMEWNPYTELYEASTATAYTSGENITVSWGLVSVVYKRTVPKVVTTGDLPRYFLYNLREGDWYSPEDVEWRFEV